MCARIVLVAGYWLGAWAWDAVVGELTERGFNVTPLTLPGLEPGRDSTAPDVTLADHASAIEAALEVPAQRRILVVHSGAAVPGTLVLDRRPDLVDRMVLVDTAPVRPGYAMDPEQVGDGTLADAWAALAEEGSFKDLTPGQLSTFLARAVPQPNRVITEPVQLGNDARHRVPLTVICCEFPASAFQQYAAQGVPFLAALLDYDDVTYVDLPTGHWPMWSRPIELAELIAQAAENR